MYSTPIAGRPLALGAFARAGFQELAPARDKLNRLGAEAHQSIDFLLSAFARAADPDSALQRIIDLTEQHPSIVRRFDEGMWRRLVLLVGASPALGDYFRRNPTALSRVLRTGGRLIEAEEAHAAMLGAVGADSPVHGRHPVAAKSAEAGATALRRRYRELLAELVLYDLLQGDAAGGEGAAQAFSDVSRSLSGLAAAALEAGLAVARATVIAGVAGPAVATQRVAATSLSIVAMGKCGANELNVVSDVDVMFIAGPSAAAETEGLDGEAMLRIATRLATETMRAIHDPGAEPPLWQVDPNLRPEGRQGALVRTLGSMLAYYDRWAKAWEFQALLKARPVAGDLALGEEFVSRTRSLVWASSAREDFVGSVQRMRERVTEHIAEEDLEYQLKLGPGGLRDIEFSVQLLQLVHGQYDETLHVAGTLEALAALVSAGYVARSDGDRLAADYRRLRLLEHRLQLRDLRRTALMPRDEHGLRVLARASHLAPTGDALLDVWQVIKREVRELHLRIFYAPLLSAVAALPEDEFVLGSDQARARLTSIGFRDPDGALRHLAALTHGSSRNARIQRNLMPVLLRWLADGTDPDFGLLAFRRVSEANRENPWYLRLLRDGTEAAERLTHVLSRSRFAAGLLESFPEAVAWLERDELLRPQPLSVLRAEMRSLASRRSSIELAAEALRAVHRREILRLALGRLVFVNTESDITAGLDAAHTALLDGLLLALRDTEASTDPVAEQVDIALIGMGRFGGGELGFASDLDVVAVYRVREQGDASSAPAAARYAERIIAELRRLVSDPRFPVDLDFDLRPEGKNGPIVRSLDAFASYYERWSLTWESQALLRARPVGGDAALGEAFIELADRIRYPAGLADDAVREVRRMKARVEAERLPRGVDPRRHLKLGPGGISDVEWLVQLLQLRYGRSNARLRTVSTLEALRAARASGLIDAESTQHLVSAWTLASEIRSAIKLWTGKAQDSLPIDRGDLEGVARVLGLPAGHTSDLEERWLAVSRRARVVCEREFFGYSDDQLQYPVISG